MRARLIRRGAPLVNVEHNKSGNIVDADDFGVSALSDEDQIKFKNALDLMVKVKTDSIRNNASWLWSRIRELESMLNLPDEERTVRPESEPKRKCFTEEISEEIQLMLSRGLNVRQISDVLGCNVADVENLSISKN